MRQRILPASVCLLPMVLLLAACGCGTSAATVSVQSTGRHYAQSFGKSCYSRTDSGEYDVILVEDGLRAGGNARGPVAAAATTPLNQLVHLHVRWRPASGNMPDAPSATNAVIDWYIRGGAANRWDLLHYSGPAFVTIKESGNEARFDIRHSQLSLASTAGGMDDPLGTSALSGTLVVRRNDSLVASALIGLQNDLVQMQASQASIHEGPPPRGPNEP